MTFADYQYSNWCEREREIARRKFENRILRRLAEIHWALGLMRDLAALKMRRYAGDKWANRRRTPMAPLVPIGGAEQRRTLHTPHSALRT